MNKLIFIPARGGSKGIPNKNIKDFDGNPLIYYSIKNALEVVEENDIICVSTDDVKIKKYSESLGIKVPFIRPKKLSKDNSETQDSIIHALSWYKLKKITFDQVLVLQPTSPLRKSYHIKDALKIWNNDYDMIVSVFETKSNPYYLLFEDCKNGFIKKSKKSSFTRRQDCPKIYEINGAIYIINPNSLLNRKINSFSRIKKYIMKVEDSIDIDNFFDWKIAEFLFKNEK